MHLWILLLQLSFMETSFLEDTVPDKHAGKADKC